MRRADPLPSRLEPTMVTDHRPNASVDGADAEVTVLLSSAGRRGALVNALRDGAVTAGRSLRVVATDCSELSAAAQLCDAFYLVPRIDDLGFIDAMLGVVEVEGPLIVVPTIDTELAILAENRKRFVDAGADVLVSAPDTIGICADKERCSEWLAANGFAVPRQYRLEELVGLPSYAWPLFFKPKNGSSSIGAQQVDSLTEVAMAIERHGNGVVEEVVTGEEYTIDCWVDADGRCRAAVPRRRLAVRAGEVAKAITVDDPALRDLASAIAEALPAARGPITIQIIVGQDGPRVIEINPRFGGGFPLTHAAGGQFTAAVVADAAGSAPVDNWFEWSADVTMLRYDEAVFYAPSADAEVGR